ncbi:hypothetical protein KC19_VG020800 [Ceratodon purpureus]|uniref:Uncharacterized protein n=1 Tax=Ceratodon purpureus TaxID=3225 RepID=A0A8T0HL72_CERPU|nr:hypothetical protein KC19_VG020800 [Ceratodon purpureus]
MLPLYHFWSSIIGASTAILQKMPITHNIIQHKIRNLHTSALGMQKQFFRLQVPMYNLVPVAVLYTCIDRIYRQQVKREPPLQ